MKNIKNIKIVVIITVLIAVVFVLVNENRKFKNKPEAVEQKSLFDRSDISYSRISFFHTKDYMGSLSIPSYWEGIYSYEEKGNKIIFYCREGEQKNSIFEITYESDSLEHSQIKDTNFYYKIENLNKFKEKTVCKELVSDSEGLIESFKSAKIK